MKNNKAFTLIELLAVIVILGILMLIAVPNTVALINKNKRSNYIENAKTFVSLVQSKVKTDKSIDLPVDSSTGVIVTLEYLNTSDIEESPYGEEYDKEASFVAITLEKNKYVYYVHLISCVKNSACDLLNPNEWRGINLVEVSQLNGDNRFELVKQSGVDASLYQAPENNDLLSGRTYTVY